MYDYIIVGAGLAGCVLAERIANVLGDKVLVIEKRDHLGGNCYDYYDEAGLLVHKYGPHIFHTQIKEVWDYLSQFTEWRPYQHRVLGYVDGKKIPIPFNLTSLYESFPRDMANRMEEKLVENYGREVQVPILELKDCDDEDLKLLADYVYRKVFLNYTKKQWGLKPEELDPSVTARVPVLVSHDDHYFQDPYQGIPKKGYTPIFEKMLKSPGIELMLNTDFKEVLEFNEGSIFFKGEEFKGKLIYTGEIDYFFDFQYGKLPYRSLDFEMETLDQEYYQEVGTVNYPNDHRYTRITEFKHLTGQVHNKTTITREYPQSYQPSRGDVPYYPIPKREYQEIYQRYREKAAQYSNLILVGRLAEYQYFNMDLVVDQALTIFQEKIIPGKRNRTTGPMTPETVCAVVVTYNRRELLIECLNALRAQIQPLEAVCIVDNASTDGTPELLQERGYLDLIPKTGERTLRRDDLVIHYLRLPENRGGSGGFHAGVKKAYQQGYQWLWLMDDDAQPELDALKKLSEYFTTEVAALASLKLDLEGNILYHHRGYFDFKDPQHLIRPLVPEQLKDKDSLPIDHTSFVGLLLKRSAVEQVGFPIEDFFIHFDDVEYCIRLQEAGKILLVKSSRILHHEEGPRYIKKEFLKKKFDFVPFDALWLSYFGTRNYLWLNHEYTESKWSFYCYLVKGYLYQLIWIVLAGDWKYRRTRILTQAYLDGVRGNFDNDKPRKILYS